MKSLTIVLNDFPYKTDRDYNALRVAGAAADRGAKVTVFLMGDSIYVAGKRQSPAEGLPNLEDMAAELIDKGVEFKLCSTCVNARGFEPREGEITSCFVGSRTGAGLTAGDFVEGARMSTMDELLDLLETSEKVVSF